MSERIPCPHCEYVAHSPGALSLHDYWVHFTCPECGKVCEHDDYPGLNGLMCHECRAAKAKAKAKAKEAET